MTDSKPDFSVDDSNWIDEEETYQSIASESDANLKDKQTKYYQFKPETIALVESAFLASTASLIWLIDYYFRIGPFLKMLFPLPIALVYLRRGKRASIITTIVCGLLLAILMGPPRSIVYIVPYGLMGIQLGALWRRGVNWYVSIFVASLIGCFGFFFRFWLFSILLGEDLWVYVISQITNLADWIFLKLGILARPDMITIQLLAIAVVMVNNIIYSLTVHLVALLMLDRLKTPIPRPPKWLQVILDYE
ncbi:DUF2232 domain-containing protein [Cyanobacterium aponinum UTEX 3222]|uniref:DUF2232 domain-containing protein n=2 Tax=Cyanobacterium aponinum TaxID=379064 RepID=K9Z6L8_CYAAP|nr:DUF2232 domain-containing protein [Cyanobacterium aponinum]WRL43239.1 DUF2232 domain-containing protein [Cyanobacterium aponinum UTEX 3222]AFZ54779.1 Protein of unknown function DUF2232, membrane [Cyanobacterium aponinum PCC 10605]PHV64042.1 DUF2232 domain-containing protein [Cyanobacterium aponinum IPPAS B-1201]WPF87845.1 DUF2232 domain-containing protein [Cyanobacterium aponinum AL20115]WRL36907.1 DUF2232 domain-containing protein [Cyanobacterium aponinum UTEX 3221]